MLAIETSLKNINDAVTGEDLMRQIGHFNWSLIRTVGACLILSIAFTISIRASDAAKTPKELKAAMEAHQGDFDYLLGDWQFVATSKQFGHMRGYWSATKLGVGNGQLMDQFEVDGDKGQVLYTTLTLRTYNPNFDRWEVVTLNGTDGLQNFGTARREGSDMIVEQKAQAATPKPILLHVRYYNIGSNSFSWKADRSDDNGKTWQNEFQTIEAKRIGPPHTIQSLIAEHKPGIRVSP